MLALDPSTDTMLHLVEETMARIIAHHQGLETARPHVTDGANALAARLTEREIPESAATLDDALRVIFDDALSVTFNTASGGYLAYIPGGGLFTSALADLIAGAINRYTGVWVAGPGLVALEENALAWIARLIGFPTTGGILTSGGSIANLAAVVAAREEKLGDNIAHGVVYTTTEAHHSVDKACRIAGLRTSQIHRVPLDPHTILDVTALKTMVAADRAAGKTPFLIVANAGSTNTGAVDPLRALSDVARAEDLWFHVDAAYGGFFAMTERGRIVLDGIADADSVTLDPHKGLFLPYGTGCLLVSDRARLRRAHDLTASYMPAYQDDDTHIDYASLGPELSRPFRGLRVWLALKLHGAAAFRHALDEKIDLARTLHRALADMPALDIVHAPALSLLTFRVNTGISDDDNDARTERLIQNVTARGRVFLTGTRVEGRFLGRACVLHLRTDAARIDMAIEDIARALDDEGA